MSLEKIMFYEYGITPSEKNQKIIDKLLRNWRFVEDLERQANFWVNAVSVHQVDEKHRNPDYDTEEHVLLPENPDLDGCTLYSGDTESDQENLKDVICKLFHDTVSADLRYEAFQDGDLERQVCWELDVLGKDKKKIDEYRSKNLGNPSKLRIIDDLIPHFLEDAEI
jgi:hypothetical protein